MDTETRDMDLVSYIERFRDKKRFEKFCKECGNYGNSWLCPPFERDPDFGAFDRIKIVVCRIPMPETTHTGNVMDILRGYIRETDDMLLRMEEETGGLAFGFSGRCPYCIECSRKSGSGCRHPEKARPSLESYGFDLCATMEELFGRSLEWASSCDGTIKEVTLIGAVAYQDKGETRSK